MTEPAELKLPKKSRKYRHIISNIFLVASLVILVLAATFVVLGKTNDIYVFGYKPFIITTGSMETDYMTYSMAVIKKGGYDETKVGDVIAFKAPALGGKLAMHRIVGISDKGFITKGDHNKIIDVGIVTRGDYVGRAVWHTNLTAYYMQNLEQPGGIWRMVVAPLVALVLIILAVWMLRRWDVHAKEKAFAISIFVLVTSIFALLFYMYWSNERTDYINEKLGEAVKQFKSSPEVEHTVNGNKVLGTIKIAKIDIEYPIIRYTSDHSLDDAITLYAGPDLNQPGNVVLAGHHGWGNLFFTRNDKLVKGDIVDVTDNQGKTLHYTVDDYYEVKPTDRSVLNQNTDGKYRLTLISCSQHAKMRYIVRAIVED